MFKEITDKQEFEEKIATFDEAGNNYNLKYQ